MSNTYPSIPDPQNNIESLAESVRALKMAVETLVGQRDGGRATRVFTQTDEPSNPQAGDMWMVANDAGAMRVWNGYFWVDISDSRFSGSGGSSSSTSVSTATVSALSDLSTEISEEIAAVKAEVAAVQAAAGKVTASINSQLTTARDEFNDLIDGLAGQTTIKIQASSATSFAQISEEVEARTTAVSGVAGRVSTIESSVNDPATSGGLLARVITEEGTRATKDSSLAGYVTRVSAGSARVFTQDTQPSSPQTGDTWFDTSNNYFPKYYNGSNWLDNNNGTYPIGKVADLQAQVDQEVLSLSTAQTALAASITSASVGTGKVFWQATAPASPAIGDVWYDTSNAAVNTYTSKYWNGSEWLDNSTGGVASVSQSLSAVKDKVNNTLGAQWAVQVGTGSQSGRLAFTGLKQADGTGSKYVFEIDSTWTVINGNALINGSLTADKIGTTSLSAITANLGTVTAGVARDSNSKFVIDFTNANITISD